MTSQLERPDGAPARPPGARLREPRVRVGRAGRARRERVATPTARAVLLVLTGILFVVAGFLAAAPPLVLLGALALAIVPACWFIALLAAQHLVETRVSLHAAGTDLPLGAGEQGRSGSSTPRATQALALGRPLALTARLTPPPRTRALGYSLTPKTSGALRIVETLQDAALANPAEPRRANATAQARPPETTGPEREELSFSLTGIRLGDGFLHGFVVRAEVALGLFAVSRWLPLPLAFKILPEHLIARSPRLSATRAVESQSELIQRDRRGFGMEIRELRDFAPGDPFKHIAWRASARRGKLISREFESERSVSVWLCLDVSPSMWWGPTGRARIDHALAMAAELARTLTSGRDKVGLVIHDHVARVVIEPGRGTTQHARMLDALLEVPHLTLEDMTEVTDRELVDHVLRWFEVQEHRTFPRLSQRQGRRTERPAPRQSPIDVAALAATCRERLRERRRVLPISAYAVDPDLATLRVFCREVGIALPPDPTPRPGGQAQGLEAALGAVLSPVAGKKASAHTIVSLTDLVTADDPDALKRVALTARRHRHGLVFVQPVGERAELPPVIRRRGHGDEERLARALLDIQSLRAEESRRRAQALLKPSGASFISVAPGESLAKILSQLEALS